MEYFLHRDGQQWGPYDEVTLRSMLAAHQIVPNDLIWNVQMADWATVESVLPTFTPVPASIPAPTPMPAAVAATTSVAAADKSTVKPTAPPAIEAKPDKTESGKNSNLPIIAAIAGASLVVVGVVLWFFISRTTSPEPRSQNEIFLERESLPALFFTAQSRRRITAPGNKQFFIDNESKEICWQALTCINPRCPALKSGGKPPVFINPNSSVFIKPDGTIGQDPARAMKAAKAGPLIACPECLKIRNVKNESHDSKEKHLSWVQPHVLPETAKRIKELEAEQKSRTEMNNAKQR